MFWKVFCVHPGYIYLIWKKQSCCEFFYFILFFVLMARLNVQVHDPSEIILICWFRNCYEFFQDSLINSWGGNHQRPHDTILSRYLSRYNIIAILNILRYSAIYIAIYYLFSTSNDVPKGKLWQHVLIKKETFLSLFISLQFYCCSAKWDCQADKLTLTFHENQS